MKKRAKQGTIGVTNKSALQVGCAQHLRRTLVSHNRDARDRLWVGKTHEDEDGVEIESQFSARHKHCHQPTSCPTMTTSIKHIALTLLPPIPPSPPVCTGPRLDSLVQTPRAIRARNCYFSFFIVLGRDKFQKNNTVPWQS